MTPWTLTMCCPLDGRPLGPVNTVRHAEPRSGICRTLIAIVECGDGHQWETEIRLVRHTVDNRWDREGRHK